MRGHMWLNKVASVLMALVFGQLCSALPPRCLYGHTDRNNTNIKHRSSSAQPCFAAVYLDGGKKGNLGFHCKKIINYQNYHQKIIIIGDIIDYFMSQAF